MQIMNLAFTKMVNLELRKHSKPLFSKALVNLSSYLDLGSNLIGVHETPTMDKGVLSPNGTVSAQLSSNF